jgi:hypothetical protein
MIAGRQEPPSQGRHRSPHRVKRLPLALALSLATVSIVALVGAVRAEDDEAASQAPASRSVLVLPVLPVGADLDGGKLSLDEALSRVDDAAEAGAVGVHMTADIHWLCPTPSCGTEPLEPVIVRAEELGLRVYLHVNSTPEWIDPRGRWFAPVGDGAAVWAGLFAQLVERFGTRVAGYEVWNEPNNAEFWEQGPDAGAYADLMKAVWTASKERNPDARLIGGVLSNNDLGFMEQLSDALAERGGNAENRFFYDDLGVHPYTGDAGEGFAPDLPAGSVEERVATGVKDMTFLGVRRLREQVAGSEGIERDVVIGEFGYTTTSGAWYYVPEPQRSEFMAEALRRAADWEWLQAFTPYTYTPEDGDGFGIPGTPTEEALLRTSVGVRD